MESSDITYMTFAMSAARQAAERGEVPVGAIIVAAGEIVGTGYNRREEQQDPLGHAEMIAIQEASRRLRSWRLEDCAMFVTLEPCVMCAGAILQARMRRLVFACPDPKAGAVESLYRLCEDRRLNHQLPVNGGVMARESAAMLAEFFSRLRLKNRRKPSTERWPSPVEGA
jgi:tRNA(adenine34) deaminase